MGLNTRSGRLMISMALGNFIASFVNDAFLGLEERGSTLTVASTSDGVLLQWNRAF